MSYKMDNYAILLEYNFYILLILDNILHDHLERMILKNR